MKNISDLKVFNIMDYIKNINDFALFVSDILDDKDISNKEKIDEIRNLTNKVLDNQKDLK